MTEAKILNKKDFFQIDECYCGKHVFRYHNGSKNYYVAKCKNTKEEYDIKLKKWVISKKQPCDFYCTYQAEPPVFLEEIKKVLIKKSQIIPDKNKALEEKLRLLFQFVFVSSHTETLDEINVLVKNNLCREPRKAYYFPSPGHLRISHYESLEEYRDRIFSKKIIDNNFVVVEEKEPLPTFLNPRSLFNLVKHNLTNKPVKAVKPAKPVKTNNIISSSHFIIVSEDDESDNESEPEIDSPDTLSEFDETDIEKEITLDEPEEEVFEEETYEDNESGDDYEDGYD